MPCCGCEMEARDGKERKTLRLVLGINAVMFFCEGVAGLLAQSTGLVADSLDMFADASVYAIGLYAVGKSAGLKTASAKCSGFAQIMLALLVSGEVLRRFFYGSEPDSGLMMGMGAIALLANIACLRLISKHRDGGAHMRASVIFSTNDVIANGGVILSGILVWLLHSRQPDLFIGLVIAFVVLRGGIQILREASENACNGRIQS